MTGLKNGWVLPLEFLGTGVTGGVGLEVSATCPGEDDGVDYTPDDAYPFVLTFHTPKSARAYAGIRAAWSEYRGASSQEERTSAQEHAHALVGEDKVPVPPGARTAFAVEFGGNSDGIEDDGSESEEDL